MSRICQSCNHEISDDARFCNNCGAPQPMQADSQQNAYQRSEPNQTVTGGPTQGQAGRPDGAPVSEVFTVDDVQKNKVIAALAYLVFFLPLIAAPDSRFGRFHANQGLLLLILSIAGNIVLRIIPFLSSILMPLFSLFCFILCIMGLANTLNGKARELPLIGQYRILN